MYKNKFLIISVLLLLLFPQLYLWPHISDDSYISFRYIANLVEGNGPTFNPGERTEGFSNPLWVIIISSINLLIKVDIPDAARIIGIIFSILSVLTIAWISDILNKNNKDFSKLSFFVISCMILLATPGFHVYMTAGLEGPLLGFLLLFGVGASLKKVEKWNLIAAFSFGLAAITRPEAPLYGLLWYLFTIKNYTSHKIHVSHEFKRALLFIIPILSYQIFRLLYYNSFLPNTAHAKPSGIFGETFGIEYLEPWLFSIGGPVILILMIVHWIFDYSRYKTIVLATIGPITGNLIFIIYAQGDWMPFGRFIIPVLPLIIINLSFWLIYFIDSIMKNKVLFEKQIVTTLIVLGILTASFLIWISPITDYVNNREYSMLMRGTDQIKVGTWLHENFQQGTTVGTYRLGGISYAAPDIIFFDLYGLTDREAAEYVKIQKGFTPLIHNPVIERKPDVLALVSIPDPDRFNYMNDPMFYDLLTDEYIFIRSFRQGHYGTFDIWLSRKSTDKYRSTIHN